LAENDDTSPDNLNSLLEYTLEADAVYFIGVISYAPGDFTLTLSSEASVEGFSQTYTGSIDDSAVYAEFPITLTEGQYLTISAAAATGNLDTYLYLTDIEYNIYAENDDLDKTTTDSYLEYEVEVSGDYLLIVTRYGQDTGESAGEFELSVSSEGGTGNNAGIASSTAADYPLVNAPTAAAEWTILAYLAGDNDLEASALIDLNEFEIAGGSDEQVRVVVFLDRSPDHDTSNGDWASARVFEMTIDSGDYDSDGYSPLIDTVELADLGSLNSGTGSTLADFLIWGVQNYPAQNYIVTVNDHGGGWTGLAGDDTTDTYISPFEFAEAFKLATEAAGMERFALLINDACLMTSIEYLDVVAPYFDYALGASEVMYGPGYDMTLLTLGLREGLPIDQLSIDMIDAYMAYFEGVEEVHPTQTPTLIDLHQFPAVTEAVENFAALVNSNPIVYARLLGEARYNSYEYGLGSWLSFLVDVGDLMIQLQRISDDPDLNAAA
ncbi:MAG: hypothetical protein K8I82_16470, partial [Anaerolineae bacterium]|nr:hypothetical protein [Anaerolineae bacterium]